MENTQNLNEARSRRSLERLVSGERERTLRVLWRTSGFLSGLANDVKPLSPERAKTIGEFRDCIEEEARLLSANDGTQLRRE